MRTVAGPTDRVVVVGAGLAGLSAALRLAGAGRRVTILERGEQPGGRAGLLLDRGYAFDTGPTVLTMPELIEDALACVGERLADCLELVPLDPVYRAEFADGSQLDVHADVDAMAGEIERLAGSAEADGYRRYVDYLARLFRLEMAAFIDRNLDSPLALAGRPLARLVTLGGFRRLATTVRRYLHDDRVQRVFSFQAMYAGLSPFGALTVYAVISYLDSVAGVTFPKGGMHAVPRALAGAAERAGVAIRYGAAVERIEVRAGRAVRVHIAGDEPVPADAVVVTADLPTAVRELLPPQTMGRVWSRRLPRQRAAPSCFLLLAGARDDQLRETSQPAHHTIDFGRAWRRTFTEIIDAGQLMSDPSFLVSRPTVTDPSLAPPGRSVFSILFPTPNLDAPLDWSLLRDRYREEVITTVERRGWPGLAEALEVEHVTTPADWRAQGMDRGTPFAAAHTFAQTGPFRAPNLAPGLDNVVFAGSGTVPGVGIPMVLLSGRLAAERITGPARS